MQPRDELVAEWLAKADDDLRVASLTLRTQPPVCWASGFHSQQAVEKLLKAILTAHDIEYDKTHAIDYLFDKCVVVEPRLKEHRHSLLPLSDYAVEARYPFPRIEPSVADAEDALKAAGALRQSVHMLLKR